MMRATRTLYAHTRAEASAAASARAEAGEAKLSALQARMNPHFLFNALNTVAALVRTDPAAAERATEHLSDVLRTTLERSASSMGTVAEEVEYVRATSRSSRSGSDRGSASNGTSIRVCTPRRSRRSCCSRWSKTRSVTASARASTAARSASPCSHRRVA